MNLGSVAAEIHRIYALQAEAEDSAKVPGNARGIGNSAPSLKWTAQP